MKTRRIKKSLALILAVLMLMSCVVATPFVGVSAANRDTPNGAEEAMVKIGDGAAKYYDTLSEAVDAANGQKGDTEVAVTITLLKDVELDGKILIEKNNCTLDGAGKTIYITADQTVRNSTNCFIEDYNITSVTFKNLTVCGQPMSNPLGKLTFGTGSTTAAAFYLGGKASKQIFDNCTITGFHSKGQGMAIYMKEDSTGYTTEDEGVTKTPTDAGLYLINTTITGNTSTISSSSVAAVRTRTSGEDVEKNGTAVYVSGKTVVANNKDSAGAHRGIMTSGSGTYAKVRVFVKDDFTGYVQVTTLINGENYYVNYEGKATLPKGIVTNPSGSTATAVNADGWVTTGTSYVAAYGVEDSNGDVTWAFDNSNLNNVLGGSGTWLTTGTGSNAADKKVLVLLNNVSAGAARNLKKDNITVKGYGRTLKTTGTATVWMVVGNNIRFEDVIFDGNYTASVDSNGKPIWNSGADGRTNIKLIGLGTGSATFANCTFQGNRTKSNAEMNGPVISTVKTGMSLSFEGVTTITNNVTYGYAINAFKKDLGSPALRTNLEGCINIQGILVLKDNYRVEALDATTSAPATTNTSDYYKEWNITVGDAKRLYISGDLYEGTEIVYTSGNGFILGTDANGKAYAGTEYIVMDGNKYPYVTDKAIAANNGKTGYQCAFTAHWGYTAFGNIGSDKFVMNFKVPYFTNMIGGTVETTVGTSATVTAKFDELAVNADDNKLIIPVVMSLHQLTQNIKLVLKDADGNEITDASRDFERGAAGKYLNTIAAGDDTAMAQVAKALLNLGGKLDAYRVWKGKTASWDTTVANITEFDEGIAGVKDSDSDNAKVTKGGNGLNATSISLVLDDEISLRVYIDGGIPEKIAITSGQTNALEKDSNGKYVEIKNIGTANLTTLYTLGDGAGNTLTCSVMSYVKIILNSSSAKPELTNVCNAIYFYFAAVAGVEAWEVTNPFEVATGQSLLAAYDFGELVA